jgi:hypothetical protein
MERDTPVDDLSIQLQMVTIDKLKFERRAETLEELVKAQEKRIEELEAELDLLRHQRRTPPMMDVGHAGHEDMVSIEFMIAQNIFCF